MIGKRSPSHLRSEPGSLLNHGPNLGPVKEPSQNDIKDLHILEENLELVPAESLMQEYSNFKKKKENREETGSEKLGPASASILREVKTENLNPLSHQKPLAGFEGSSLEQLLQGSRRKLYSIEKQKQEASVLEMYKPIKIVKKDQISLGNGFQGGLEECFQTGKQSLPKFTHQMRSQQSKENILSSQLPLAGNRVPYLTPNKDCLEGETVFGQSLKKMSLLEKEKANQEIRNKYTPIEHVIEEESHESEVVGNTLEDVLKHSTKKLCRVLREKELLKGESFSNKKAKENSNLSKSTSKPEERVLMFDEELFQPKECYETEQDRLNKIFQHKSRASCYLCKLPLFSKLRSQEKTKSLACGKKFHMSCLFEYFESEKTLSCPRCREFKKKQLPNLLAAKQKKDQMNP